VYETHILYSIGGNTYFVLYSIGGVSVWPHMHEIWHMGTQSTQCTCVFFNSHECMTLHEHVTHMIVVHTVV
jgi:hypothetical protein